MVSFEVHEVHAISFTGFLWSHASGAELLGKDIFAATVSPDCVDITSCSKQQKAEQVSLKTSSKNSEVVQVQQKPCVSGIWLLQDQIQPAIGLVRVRQNIVEIRKGTSNA